MDGSALVFSATKPRTVVNYGGPRGMGNKDAEMPADAPDAPAEGGGEGTCARDDDTCVRKA